MQLVIDACVVQLGNNTARAACVIFSHEFSRDDFRSNAVSHAFLVPAT